MKPTKQQVERAADAIKFMVPLNGSDTTLNGKRLAGWTPKGLATVKWPRSFGKDERAVIRLIAETVLSTAARRS